MVTFETNLKSLNLTNIQGKKTLLWLPCQNKALSHASGGNFFLFLQQPKHDNKCYLSRNPHRTNDGRGL